jgi:hypothetical protein
MQEVISGMRKKEINSMEWIDRGKWRRKIKLKLQAQEHVETQIPCIEIDK